MKKIINGKRYDTDTSEALGSFGYGLPGDFNYFYETLYRKNTGEYFLHGFGGAASRYAVSEGDNNWGSGETIIPMTLEAAKKWAEENFDGDEYDKIFGAPNDDSKKTVTFSLPMSVIEKIKQEASRSGISLSDYVANCIRKA